MISSYILCAPIICKLLFVALEEKILRNVRTFHINVYILTPQLIQTHNFKILDYPAYTYATCMNIVWRNNF